MSDNVRFFRILSDDVGFVRLLRILSDLSDNDGLFWTVDFCRILQILSDFPDYVG